MYVESSIPKFEKTLHSFATSYEDLLEYQEEAQAYVDSGDVPVPLQISWNKEFIKTMFSVTEDPEQFTYEWVVIEGDGEESFLD